MACDYCNHCHTLKDLDWEDGYYLVNGEYWCVNCCVDTLSEEEFQYLEDEGEITIVTDEDYEFDAGEWAEWRSYDPEC